MSTPCRRSSAAAAQGACLWCVPQQRDSRQRRTEKSRIPRMQPILVTPCPGPAARGAGNVAPPRRPKLSAVGIRQPKLGYFPQPTWRTTWGPLSATWGRALCRLGYGSVMLDHHGGNPPHPKMRSYVSAKRYNADAGITQPPKQPGARRAFASRQRLLPPRINRRESINYEGIMVYMGGALYIVPAVHGGYSAYSPQPTLLRVGPPIRNPGTRPMPLERRLRHSLHTPQHKCCVMLDHDGGSVPVRLLL